MSALGRAKPILETLSTVLVILAASVLLWTLLFKRSSQSDRPPLVESAEGTIEKAHLTNSMGDGPLAIVEFSDFQCPFCAKHAQETIPALKQELQGKVRYIVLHFPLEMHPQAIPSAEAAECAAEQGKYWDMHDLLFAKQKELGTADYVVYGRSLGLDTERFSSCLANDAGLAKVKTDRELAKRLGATATPTLFLGRVRADGGVDLVRRVNGAAGLDTVLAEAAKL